MAADGELAKELGHDLLLFRGVEPDLFAAEPVGAVRKEVVERHHHVLAGEIGGDVVRVGDAYVGRGGGGNVGDDVVVDLGIVGVKADRHVDIGIKLLKVRHRLLIDLYLGLVGVVLGPEGDVVVPAFVKALRDLKYASLPRAVAARQQGQTAQQPKRREDAPDLHPLVPPLETPSMIFLRKIRNRTISGRDTATTAAIMAGMFSRPKPLSRMVWMPLDTRK